MLIYKDYLQAFEALAKALSELNRNHRIVKVKVVSWDRADLLGVCQLTNLAISEEGRKFIVPSILFEKEGFAIVGTSTKGTNQ